MELFGTAGIRGPVTSTVTPESALVLGRAFAEAETEIAVGRDGRTSSDAISRAVIAGALSAGADVIDYGLVPTPTLAFCSRGQSGIMVTASHNPPGDNGLKFFENAIEIDPEREAAVEHAFERDEPPVEWCHWGEATASGYPREYHRSLYEYLTAWFGKHPLEGLGIAVDCGNGVGALETPALLNELGADVISLNANVDGHFPGRESKPTDESIRDCRQLVRQGDYDLGVAHDGDADRTVIIDPAGEIVHEDTVLAVCAKACLKRSTTNEPVVLTTPNASARIDTAVESMDARVERTGLGALHEGIERIESSDPEGSTVVFAAEPWKHIYPDFGPWIDGILAACVVACLTAEAGGIDRLCDPIEELPYRKVNVPCPDEYKAAAMERAVEEIPDVYPTASVDTRYGLRLDFEDGSWVLLRPSGTEACLRIYAESPSVETLIDEVEPQIRRIVETIS